MPSNYISFGACFNPPVFDKIYRASMCHAAFLSEFLSIAENDTPNISSFIGITAAQPSIFVAKGLLAYNRSMKYLIDGHNLIPKVAGLDLSDPEDEMQLIEKLGPWARANHASVTVFFDRSPKANAGTRNFGAVRAVFVSAGKIADTAIMETLARMGSSARNVAVVSSDRMVQAAVRAAHAKVIPSDLFADMLQKTDATDSKSKEEKSMTESELLEWVALFSTKDPKIQ